jgi:hypothetical protein
MNAVDEMLGCVSLFSGDFPLLAKTSRSDKESATV